MKRIPERGSLVLHEKHGKCRVVELEVDRNNRTWIYIQDNNKRVLKVAKESLTSTE